MADATNWQALPERVRAIGPRFDLEVLNETRALYAPLVAAQPADGIEISRDLAYGPHERHRLDLFRGPGAGRPVIIFIHGGGFVVGDKNVDELFYTNLGTWFARAGFLAITANYRRAPDFPWPAGSEDVGRVAAWAREHAAAHGGDPARIFLFGQSAGACHVAGYLFDPALQPAAGPGVAGGVLMSGVYRAYGEDVGPGMLAYFGPDEGPRRAHCPMSRVNANRTPLLIGVMELDPPVIATHSFELALALMRHAGRSPKFAWFEGHNHASTVYCFGSGQDDIGQAIGHFVETVGSGRG